MNHTPIDSLDRESYRESLGRAFPAIVRYLADTIGFKLTAYIGRRRHTDRVQAWIDGAKPCGDVEARLRHACGVVMLLRRADSAEVVAAWLQGMNPELDDRVPIVLLREGASEVEGKEVLAAAKGSSPAADGRPFKCQADAPANLRVVNQPRRGKAATSLQPRQQAAS